MLRLAVLVLPAGIMAVLGYDFMARLVGFLLAAEQPVQYVYEGADGLVTVKADRYYIDFERGEVSFTRPRIQGPRGEVSVEARRLVAAQAGPGWRVKMSQVKARVIRQPDGKFDVESLAPKAEGDDPAPKIWLEIDGAALDYTDETAAPRIERRAEIQQLSAGLGPEGLAIKSDFQIAGQPVVDLAVTAPSDGPLRVEAQADGLDVAREQVLIRRLAGPGMPDLGSSAIVQGLVALEAEEGAPLKLYADLDAAAAGIRVPGWLEGERIAGSAIAISDGLETTLSLTRAGLTADFQGVVRWAGSLRVQGQLSARVASRSELPLEVAKLIDPAVEFRGLEASGPISIEGDKAELDLAISAATAELAGEPISGLRGRLSVRPASLAISTQGQWLGSPLRAEISANTETGRLAGWATVEDLSLAAAAKRAEFSQRIAGQSDIRARISGTLQSPIVDADAEGQATFEAQPEVVLNSRRFQVRARWSDGVIALQRAVVDSQDFTAAAEGEILVEEQRVDLRVQVQGLDLGAFSDDVEGAAFGTALVRGPLADPITDITATGVGVTVAGQIAPQVQLQAQAAGGILDIKQLTAITGSGVAQASGTVILASGELNLEAQARDLQAGSWNPAITGWVDLTSVKITGSAADPVVEGAFYVEDILAQGVELESAQGRVTLANGQLAAVGNAEIDEGRAEFALAYDMSAKSGGFSAQINGAPLSRAPLEVVKLGGELSGDIEGRFSEEGLLSALASLSVSEITVDGVPVGSGGGEASWSDGAWTGSAEVGSLDRYVLAESMRYQPSEEPSDSTISGEVTVYQIEAPTLAELARIRLQSPSPELENILRGAEGQVSLTASLSGQAGSPEISIQNFEANELGIDGKPLGAVTGSATRSADGLWTTPAIAWRSEGGAFDLMGSISEDGSYSLQNLTITDVDLGLAASIFGQDLPFSAKASNAVLAGRGTLEEPMLQGSLLVNEVSIPGEDGQVTVLPVNVILEQLSLSSGKVSGLGSISYRGFTGRLTADAPLDLLLGEESDDRINARLDVESRPLQELSELLTGLNLERSQGELGGTLQLTGTPEDLELTGQASLTPGAGRSSARLSIDGLETELEDAVITITLAENQAVVQAGGRGTQGGQISLNASADLEPLLEGNASRSAGDIDVLARLQLTDLRVEQPLKFGDLPPADQPSRVQVSGDLELSGSTNDLVLSGGVAVSEGRLVLPAALPAGGSATPVSLNLALNSVRLSLAEPASFVLPVGEVRISGEGVVTGTLAEPTVSAPLVVAGGEFSLPSGAVDLQPGGSVNVTYSGGEARAQLSMEATTSIVARRLADQFERYRVTLFVSGNALAPEGLNIFAVSEPPDLTSDEIMAVIGQKELIEGLVGNVIQRQNEEFLRGALYNLALPALTQGISANLAESLRLDYVTFEYNPFEQAIIRAGRELGSGLQISGYRQLFEPAFGPQRWDLRLTYRLPSRDALLSRVRLGLGSDQDRAWKVFVDWSRRF